MARKTSGAFNGAEWLSTHQRDLIDAEFAVNEGAFGELDTEGHPVAMEIQAGEKQSQNFRLEVTNAGGHSSRPLKVNAIYQLAGALKRIEPYEFPAQFTDGNRAYFKGMAKIEAAKGEIDVANAMNALVQNPSDAAAIALVSSKDPGWNATLRTTCVATMLDAGHATNALPQRARANINCRIFPGVAAETVRQKLQELAADPAVKVTTLETRGPSSPPPPLTPAVMGPFEKTLGEVLARSAGRSDPAAGRDGWPVLERGRHPDLWDRAHFRRTGPRPYPRTQRVRWGEVIAAGARFSLPTGEDLRESKIARGSAAQQGCPADSVIEFRRTGSRSATACAARVPSEA